MEGGERLGWAFAGGLIFAVTRLTGRAALPVERDTARIFPVADFNNRLPVCRPPRSHQTRIAEKGEGPGLHSRYGLERGA